MRLSGLAAAAILAAAPVAAADLEPDDTAAVKLIRGGLTTPPNPIELRPAFTLQTGGGPLQLGTTPLVDIAKAMGGTVNRAGKGERAFEWLCYAAPAAGPTPPTLYWMIARGEDETAPLSAVAMELAPATTPASCTTLTQPYTLTSGMPGLGADYQVLVANFGTSDRDPSNVVAYAFPATASGEGQVTVPELRYALDGEKVTAVYFSATRKKAE